MDKLQIVIVFASLVGVVGFGALAYVLLGGAGNKRSGDMRELMVGGGAAGGTAGVGRVGAGASRDGRELDPDEIRRRTSAKTSSNKTKTDDLSSKLFKAGFFTANDRRRFLQFRVASFLICIVLFPVGLYTFSGKPILAVTAAVLGALIGFSLPMSWLERQIRQRQEEVMYYLPLVIEQVSIGVSSALDVGPCLAHIVEMAGERDSHNAVTEMFVHVEKLIRSGLSLEDALIEVGEANGSNEVKHAFMFLAQCAKHGGELSKQLQELADSVMVQRQVAIEGKISALPVKATGPLAMVFAGFFALLFAGLLVRLLNAFGG